MDIKTFAQTYKDRNYPHDYKLMSRVVHTDVSTSVLVFSENEFLVELYMMHPNAVVVNHSHPFENIALFYSGEITGTRENFPNPVTLTDKNHGQIGNPLPMNHWHGFKVGPNGCVFYNISRWDNPEQKDSAIFKYIGAPLGPLHESLLKQHYES